jgi:hypothetical protein
MRSLRAKYNFLLFWLPLALVIVSAELSGGQVHRYTDIPLWLSPFNILIGITLIAGALIAMSQPQWLSHMFKPESEQSSNDIRQILGGIIFGAVVVGMSVMRIIYA